MKDCFIICPLSKAGSDIRKRADLLLNHILKPVLKINKYKPIRADQIPKAGLITTQIINLIIDSPLVIADLTGANPNVFYELAIRHAAKKPYIQIIEKGEKIPFDIGAVRTVEIDHTDLDNVEAAKTQISSWIKEFDKGYIPDSPISVAKNTKLLQEDEELAEKIEYFTGRYPDYYYEGNTLDLMEKLTGQGWYTIKDLDKKLDKILKLVENKTDSG